jgi:hypothetical protein
VRILFDQGTPAPLRRHLTGHQVETAYERGWSNLKNGELLDAAEREGFSAGGAWRPADMGDRRGIQSGGCGVLHRRRRA